MKRLRKRAAGAAAVVFLMSAAGVAGAAFGDQFGGPSRQDASLRCPGGMTSLSHVLNEDASIFPGDPETEIEVVFTIENDFFLLERLELSTHTSTHFDAPGHFIDGGRLLDDLEANEFVFEAYVIDVRDRIAVEGGEFQLEPADIRAYERLNGTIPAGALVVLQTGWEDKFATPAYIDDLAPGFSFDAVQWMFDERGIDALGSDTLGPDAYTDENFDATYATLLNDGFAIPGMNNVDALDISGDLVIVAPVLLEDGSGIQVNPIGCHSSAVRADRPAVYPGLD
jgi:kynurenine formamidase